MKYEINISQKAEDDLNSAADYIEHVLLNAEAADHLLDESEKLIEGLSQYPERYPVVDDPLLKFFHIRMAPVKNYLVFYTVNSAHQSVTIVRFLFNKRDWISVLRNQKADL
ncbi:MAG: type II toxin-antitoxin system RelE/ParE family toxin [Erysipelotrichaceae bacterium]|nr:type II toxin-antitoxin system RelE/ParE family toxin [Erysipelotrichaceae bacterium]